MIARQPHIIPKPRNSMLALFVGMLAMFAGSAFAQVTIERQVIGSTGHFSEAGPVSVSATVGEPVVQTFSFADVTLTQGFQQPRVGALMTLDVSLLPFDATCLNSADGFIVAEVLNGTPPYSFAWSPLPTDSDTLQGLNPGTYSVLVSDATGAMGQATVELDAETLEDCGLHVYSGITPNNDNHNDFWLIDNIEMYGSNSVEIYNRWGDKVWEAANYDNVMTFFEGISMRGTQLPEGTYFYIIKMDAMEAQRGWLQISR